MPEVVPEKLKDNNVDYYKSQKDVILDGQQIRLIYFIGKGDGVENVVLAIGIADAAVLRVEITVETEPRKYDCKYDKKYDSIPHVSKEKRNTRA